jgi:hypothetical protein
MKSAPKDGSYILIAYPAFSGSGEIFVGHARWTTEPHSNTVDVYVSACWTVGSLNTNKKPVEPCEPHWETAYVATISHAGRFWSGHSFEPRSVRITKPLGWMPVPEPSSKIKRLARNP